MDRLLRQEQYFEKFIPKAKKAIKRNVFLGIDICNKLDKKGMMYTDMSMSEIAYVISEVLKCDFSFDEIKKRSVKYKRWRTTKRQRHSDGSKFPLLYLCLFLFCVLYPGLKDCSA